MGDGGVDGGVEFCFFRFCGVVEEDNSLRGGLGVVCCLGSEGIVLF